MTALIRDRPHFHTAGPAVITMWAEPDQHGWRIQMVIKLEPRQIFFRHTTGPYATLEIAEEAIKRQMRGEA